MEGGQRAGYVTLSGSALSIGTLDKHQYSCVLLQPWRHNSGAGVQGLIGFNHARKTRGAVSIATSVPYSLLAHTNDY
jgi:hypothetical protein